jgi:hypothetical protein
MGPVDLGLDPLKLGAKITVYSLKLVLSDICHSNENVINMTLYSILTEKIELKYVKNQMLRKGCFFF